MTIESILGDLTESVGISVENLSVASEEPHMRQLVSLMNQTGQDIVKRTEWSRTYASVDIPASVKEFSLPSDYYKMAERGTIVTKDPGGFVPIRVIPEPATWQFIQKERPGRPFAHISGGKVLFYPNSSAHGSEMTYVKRGWLTDGTERVTSDTQEPVFPEYLLLSGVLWRWHRRAGLPYDDLVAEFEANYVAAIRADRGLV